MNKNPIIGSDFPDPDMIRVGDTYYMISTTMHFMPGAVILRSFDLLNWEIFSYVYQELDPTEGQTLIDGKGIYGKGMWAASLKHHKGVFYVCFVANDTRKTYLYRAKDIAGPWTLSYIEGFYHDNSLLFDDDGRTYIVYGNGEIYLTELDSDLSKPREGGLHRIVVEDSHDRRLRFEGAHIYKIDGWYYLMLIHWLKDGSGRRTQACFSSRSLEGVFTGGDVLDDDIGFFNNGIAQGGLVDTPWGDWYAILFQDHGAVGRIPVVVPARIDSGSLTLGTNKKAPRELEILSTRPAHVYEPIGSNDDFSYVPDSQGRIALKKAWQWNHIPDHSSWALEGGGLSITASRVSKGLLDARNTLTQYTVTPFCEVEIELDGRFMNEGDVSGLCALQGRYAFVGLERTAGGWDIVMRGMGESGEVEHERIPASDSYARFKARFEFAGQSDSVRFLYLHEGDWKSVGKPHPLFFTLDHFTGCRAGIFHYAVKNAGGKTVFLRFRHSGASLH